MEKQSDIVIVGIQPWDIEIGSNCKNMALEFSKKGRVIYINPALDRITAFKDRKSPKTQKRIKIRKGFQPMIERINPNLYVVYPNCILESIQFLPHVLFKQLNYINNKRFAASISEVLLELKVEKFILFNDSDMFRSFHLKELLNPMLYVYYTRDQLMTVPYWYKHGRYLEPKLMAKSDLVVGNSPHLIEMASQFNPQSEFIGQGCDVQEYLPSSKEQQVEEFKQIKGPKIGYVGLLTTRRLDADLLYNLAQERKDWNFIFIGPEETCFQHHALHHLENVHFLGNKKANEIPIYVKQLDVCINPQVVNELTKSNYPRKIDEYLASGKPVVATDTPTMKLFEHVVSLCKTKESYLQKIHEALTESEVQEKSQKRIAFALEHTWENCIHLFWKAINHHTKKYTL